MKRFLFLAMVLCGVVVFAVPGGAVTISEVGSVDTLFASADLDNSGSAETAWLESLFPGAVWTVYNVNENDWEQVTDAGNASTYALLLEGSPEYFFIKTAEVAGQPEHFMFTNLDELNYAVVNYAITGLSLANIGKISHIGEGPGTPQVPEASTLMLLGFGLAGVGTIRRFLKR